MANREEVKASLLALNITKVVADISGSGDSGWVDLIKFYAGEEEFADVSKDLIDSSEQFVFNCLDSIIPGFVNNDGGFGMVEWDTFNDIVTVNGGTYYTETYEFDEVTM